MIILEFIPVYLGENKIGFSPKTHHKVLHSQNHGYKFNINSIVVENHFLNYTIEIELGGFHNIEKPMIIEMTSQDPEFDFDYPSLEYGVIQKDKKKIAYIKEFSDDPEFELGDLAGLIYDGYIHKRKIRINMAAYRI